MHTFLTWLIACVVFVAPLFAKANTFDGGFNVFDKRDYVSAKAIWLVLAVKDGQTAA
jgi:hypothetical protein